MSKLGPKTVDVINKLISAQVANEVCELLARGCEAKALGCDEWSPEQMERIWFAVLKVACENKSGSAFVTQEVQLQFHPTQNNILKHHPIPHQTINRVGKGRRPVFLEEVVTHPSKTISHRR